jgi:CheY-like chemotaxis protein
MPLIPGEQCTRCIRSYESKQAHAAHSRIAIIAVSTSVREQAREEYTETKFDGWILKLVNLKRLEVILAAVGDEEVRRGCLYEHGEWSVGGWFF